MRGSTFLGAVIGFLVGASLGLLLCQGNACVTWFHDLSPVIVLALGVIGLLLGVIGGAIYGGWVSGDYSG
ncbi:MAG: hypothetical protein ACK2UH_09250 [Candidatus Promineifilaceae bacterium]|jgi:hypothetical protein